MGVSIGISRPSFGDLIGQSRWIERAWTFQELVLSKRCLIFIETEAFYYCGTLTYRVSMIEDADSEREHWSRDQNTHLLGNVTITKATEDADRLCRMYEAAMQEYTCRIMSCQMDGLNAFRGLSSSVGSLLGMEMVFGVPTCMLIASFVWRPYSFTTDPNQWPRRRMMTDEMKEDNDKHLHPLFPSWN